MSPLPSPVRPRRPRSRRQPSRTATADTIRARRGAIRELAERHGLETVRWWPPNDGDLLVGGLPLSLREFRDDLERALGGRVAIYLADCLPEETRHRLQQETVDLLEAR